MQMMPQEHQLSGDFDCGGKSYGPSFGYNPNVSKTYLIVKQEHVELAKIQFADTDVAITTYGKRHLGAATVKSAIFSLGIRA